MAEQEELRLREMKERRRVERTQQRRGLHAVLEAGEVCYFPGEAGGRVQRAHFLVW